MTVYEYIDKTLHEINDFYIHRYILMDEGHDLTRDSKAGRDEKDMEKADISKLNGKELDEEVLKHRDLSTVMPIKDLISMLKLFEEHEYYISINELMTIFNAIGDIYYYMDYIMRSHKTNDQIGLVYDKNKARQHYIDDLIAGRQP